MKKNTIFTAILSVFLLFSMMVTYARNVQTDIAQSILRLHVIANSDDDYDQDLKLAVRDRIVKETKHLFENSTSPEETKQIASENFELFQSAAKSEILAQGYDYDVNVSIGSFMFPSKVYGDVCLPAGYYDALKIVIGSGNGENWWCVLFPPLCFVDGVNAELPSEAKDSLKNNLTDEEYALITENNSSNVSVQVRFKIIELLAPFF